MKKQNGKEEAELYIEDLLTEYYEEVYMNENEDVGEIDDYIEEQLGSSGQKTTSGDYIVTMNNKEIEVTKDGETIATGTLEDGTIDWNEPETKEEF